MRVFHWLRANRSRLATIYGKNSVDFYRAVFLSSLGRSFAAMLVIVHAAVMFPGLSLLDDQTKQWLIPFIAILVALLFCSAWLVEHGYHAAARYLTNFTISSSTMLSVILCGGFLQSHATPFLLAPIVVAFCISPPREAIAVGSITFFLPLLLEGVFYSYGLQIPDYTSVSNPTANTIFLLTTLFITVFISLTYLQKTNFELHLALDRDKQIFEQWASIDPLTEIGNRRAFDLWLEEAHNKAVMDGSKFVLIYLDLNGFKPVNDQFGHEVGDQVLKVIAQRLHAITGEVGNLARLGGDEFAVVLTEPHRDEFTKSVISRIHAAVEDPIQIVGTLHKISTSIGQAVFPDDAGNVSELLRAADMDMYAYKLKDKLLGISELPGSASSDIRRMA